MTFILHTSPGKGHSRLISETTIDSFGADTPDVDLHVAHKLAHGSRSAFKPIQRMFRDISTHQIVRNVCTEAKNALLTTPSPALANLWPSREATQGQFVPYWGSPRSLSPLAT
ncbi:MAG: hypothetical protein HQL63_13290 [Magnetococcales bacterium]|nr:hypothetical protein [Magnetococcales bacterium]MBF0321466.1 hypothetical protein [Magnetococcales bacterium]